MHIAVQIHRLFKVDYLSEYPLKCISVLFPVVSCFKVFFTVFRDCKSQILGELFLVIGIEINVNSEEAE